MRSNPTLRKWYKTYNRKYFHNQLPKDTKVYYEEELIDEGIRKQTYGEMDWTDKKAPEIRINPLLREQGWHSMILLTLLHEMAHVEKIQRKLKGSDHGKAWEGIMLRLAKQGAFSERNSFHTTSLW